MNVWASSVISAPAADASVAEAAQVLDAAAVAMRAAGCSVAAGPMDGDTWHSYCFVTWRGREPRFALEPDQPNS